MFRSSLITLFLLTLAIPSFSFASDNLASLEAVVAASQKAQPGLNNYLATVETSRIEEMMTNLTSGMPADVKAPPPPVITKFWQRNGKSLVYASSSSVYGLNEEMPFSTRHNVDHPISLYAATKKSTELMAHTYSYLYRLPTTGLRFFTVYGPWGRPDMAIFKFVKSILQGSPIDVYNHGNMKRDFTYIDDIAAGIIKTIDHPAQENGNWQGQNPDPSTSPAPYKVYNIGNSSPVLLLDFIETIEKFTGREAQKNMLPMQPGDVPATWADCSALEEDFGYRPNTPIEKGVEAFVSWYKEFYPVRTGER